MTEPCFPTGFSMVAQLGDANLGIKNENGGSFPEKHRTSWGKSTEVLPQKYGGFIQRSPMFSISGNVSVKSYGQWGTCTIIGLAHDWLRLGTVENKFSLCSHLAQLLPRRGNEGRRWNQIQPFTMIFFIPITIPSLTFRHSPPPKKKVSWKNPTFPTPRVETPCK